MRYKKLLLHLLIVTFLGLHAVDAQITVPLSEKGERRIVVVVASYNNQPYYRRNLDSIFSQNYENYHVLYINDCSTDNTLALVEAYIKNRKVSDRVMVIANKERRGALANHYHAIHEHCKDTDLAVIVDGDDWLFNMDVFSHLNSVYKDPNVWMTYGQFVQYPSKDRGWCKDMPREVVEKNTFRDYTHNPGHLRTFYAGLFKQIKKEDLMYQDDFLRMCADNAVMFPMIEMARNGHFKFIGQLLLVWNGENSLNDHKVVRGLQYQLDRVIRVRRRYDAIETPFRAETKNEA
ncbi:MAG TPA: glycosyltransferase family 2 protein [bacterium]|nr:glycosyltransferase family 2 protein [bacterium]